SGIDMTRDIKDRLHTLMGGDLVLVQRLALTRAQIDQYRPPPNWAKLSDSRCEAYTAAHGRHSWELDALEPTVLVALIRNAILPLQDKDLWAQTVAREQHHRQLLKDVGAHWPELASFV